MGRYKKLGPFFTVKIFGSERASVKKFDLNIFQC